MNRYLKLLLPLLLLFSITSEVFAKSYGSKSFGSKSYGSSKSKSYGFGGSSSKSKSYGFGSSSNSSSNKSYGSSNKSTYGSSSSSFGSSQKSNLNNSSSNKSTYGSSSTKSKDLSTSKKVLGGAAIGTGTAIAADSLSTPTTTTPTNTSTSTTTVPKYGSSSTSGTTSNSNINSSNYYNTYKKPEMSEFDKAKATNIQKQASVPVKETSYTQKDINMGGSNYRDYSPKYNPNTSTKTSNNESYNPKYNTNPSLNVPYTAPKVSNSYRDYSKKTYHYDTRIPYGNNYTNYGLGGYYGHSVMNYLPAMMLVYMLNDNTNTYDAQRYYQEVSNESEIKKWRAEMEQQAITNNDIKEKLKKLDSESSNNSIDLYTYEKNVKALKEKLSKEQADFIKEKGTKIIYPKEDKIMKDEVVFESSSENKKN